MSSSEKMRSFDLEGRRRGIRLDEATWQAIDWLAAQRGVKWAELARAWAGQSAASDENLTRAIRSAATHELLSATIFNDQRAFDVIAQESHGVMRNAAALSDDERNDLMDGATVQGAHDFGGFTVVFGHDEFGQDFVLIENNMRNQPHLVIQAALEVGK